MDATIEYKAPGKQTTIELPPSKSISNRLAIIYALAGATGNLETLKGTCDDIDLIASALANGTQQACDAGDSGTAMRFLLSYLTFTNRKVTLKGSQRLSQRPVSQLVEALQGMGAKLRYAGEKGRLPIAIEQGTTAQGAEINLSKGIESSQIVSSLMLIAPMMEKGMQIILPQKATSRPYIDMTGAVMRDFGADVKTTGQTITIAHSPYRIPKQYGIEPDWSAAAFWFELAAIEKNAAIALPGLKEESIQGDSRAAGLFKSAGVEATWHNGTCLLHNNARPEKHVAMALNDTPDLVLPFAVACLANGTQFELSGIKHLKDKESDRIEALLSGAAALGFKLKWNERCSVLAWDGERVDTSTPPSIDARSDHRVAMAFTIAAAKFNRLEIKGIDCVKKSYPQFLSHIREAGFAIKEICNTPRQGK